MLAIPFSEKQRKVVRWFGDSPYRFHVAQGAVRSGKTMPYSIGYAMHVMGRTDATHHAITGVNAITTARNVVEADFGFLWALRALGYSPRFTRAPEPKVRVPLHGGGEKIIHVLGCENEKSVDRIAGLTLGSLFADEFARYPQEVFEMLWSRLSVKTLAGVRAKAFGTCNPGPSQHWALKQYIENPEINAVSIHFLMDDNPSLDEETKAEIASGFVGVAYQRYVLGLWVDFTGLCYPKWVKGRLDASKPVRRWRMGFDWAHSRIMAAVMFGEQEDGVVAVADNCYDSQTMDPLTPASHCSRLIKWANGVTRGQDWDIVGDPSTDRNFKKEVRAHGIRWTNGRNEKPDGIYRTNTRLATGDIVVDEDGCPNLVKEFGSYRWDERAAMRGEDKPVKKDDHFCDATRYFAHTTLGVNRVIHAGPPI